MQTLRYVLSHPHLRKIWVARTVGNMLLLSTLWLLLKTAYDPLRMEIGYNYQTYLAPRLYGLLSTHSAQTLTPIPLSDRPVTRAAQSQLAQLLRLQHAPLTPIDSDFSLVIPKIAANARIIPQVSVLDEQVYLPALQQGVAHAAGTALPGEGGHIFLFAHSTDYVWNIGSYNAVFYLLYKLEKNDEVTLYYKGRKHVYVVTGKTVVAPSDVGYLTQKTNHELLTLQTCWPPGTTLQRILVFAQPKVTN